MFKKLTAICIAMILCIAMVSCSGDDAPDGMHDVTAQGQPFILYTPSSWANNSDSGISGAYVNADGGEITVSARFYSRGEDVTLDAFVTDCLNSYSAYAKEFSLISNEASFLGGADAKEIIYTAKNGEVGYTFCHRIAKHTKATGFVILSLSSPTSSYESIKEQYTLIAEKLVLSEMPATPADNVTDKKTPVGMKIASANHIEYRLYVPTSWVCNSESGRSEAYVNVAGKPNVNVTSFSPDSSDVTVEKYWETCEAEYAKTLPDFTLVSTDKKTVAEREAVSYTYTAKYEGVSLKLMQTILTYNGMIYSITYTATESDFDTYLDDVSSILGAFRFRQFD